MNVQKLETLGLPEVFDAFGQNAIDEITNFLSCYERQADFSDVTFIKDFGSFTATVSGYHQRESKIIIYKNSEGTELENPQG